MAFSTDICWTSPFVILGVLNLFCRFFSSFKRKIVLANTVDSDQTPHDVVSDQGLHCLLDPLWVSG